MKTLLIGASALLVLAAGPALAQFAPPSGSGGSTGGSFGGGTVGGGQPSISGAGTGLSAPSTINPAGNGITNPNAMPGLSAPAAPPMPQPVYPGVGIGGAGLPPGAVGRARPNNANPRPR